MGDLRGFSLIELLVVVAILAVLSLIAVPYVQEWLYALEAQRVEQAFVQGLRQARTHSYITKQDTVICTVNDQGKCERSAKTSLVVFGDANRNHQKDDNESMVYQNAWRLRYGSIVLNASATRGYLRYMGDTAKPRGHIGHLRYCSVSKNKRLSFKVIVNMYGNVRVERGDLVGVGC